MSFCICNHILCTTIDKAVARPHKTQELAGAHSKFELFQFPSPLGLIIAGSSAPTTDPS